MAELGGLAGITDLEGFIKALLNAKTDIEGLSAAQLVEKILKLTHSMAVRWWLVRLNWLR